MPNRPIQKLVVLMLENNSFDRMLGWVPGVGDLGTSRHWNAVDPSDPTSDRIYVDKVEARVVPNSPNHDVSDVSVQLFGPTYRDQPVPPGTPATGEWFVYDHLTTYPGDAAAVMSCLSPSAIPMLARLAQDFTACTNWFASVPGPTTPNRLFATCAGTNGYAGDKFLLDGADGIKAIGEPFQLSQMESVFGRLTKLDVEWGAYFEWDQFATELVLDEVAAHPERCILDPGFDLFISAIEENRHPHVSFLTPHLGVDSQHPPEDVKNGDDLIGKIFAAVRGSAWKDTALVVTYDEHGGFFDSRPPTAAVLNPHDPPAIWPEGSTFDFTRLGVRVPAVLVSAYCGARVDTTLYEHASIPATLGEMFGFEPLTRRDAAAASFLARLCGKS